MRHVHVWVDCHREALKIICSSWTGFNQQALSMMPLQRRLGSSCQQSLTNTRRLTPFQQHRMHKSMLIATAEWFAKPPDLDSLDTYIMHRHQEKGKQTLFITAHSARTTHKCQLMGATPSLINVNFVRLVAPQASTSIPLHHGGAVPLATTGCFPTEASASSLAHPHQA